MIKLVAFDLDDTLYNEKDFVFGAFKEVCAYLGEKYNLDRELLYKDMLKVLEEQGRGRIFNDICEKYGVKEQVEKLVQVYREAKPKIQLYEDSVYMLKLLREKYKLGLITDGMASVQWNKIKALGVENYVDKIIVTDDLGTEFWKPHTKSYEIMTDYFGLRADQCIYIGDNPKKDFIGARKKGFHTIRVIREMGDHISVKLDGEYDADFTVYKLENILEIIEAL